MKETEFYGPEEAEQKMDEIIRLGEIEVQIKAYLYDITKGQVGSLVLDLDDLKTILYSAIDNRVEVTGHQKDLGKNFEQRVMYDAVGIPVDDAVITGVAIAEALLDWVSNIKEKVAQ